MPRKRPKRHERHHGQGTIRELPGGRVRAWKSPQPDGSRPSRTFRGADARVQAEHWIADYSSPEGLLLGQYLEIWYAARAPTLSHRTRTNYASALGHLGALVERPLAAITLLEWQAWLSGLLERGIVCWRWGTVSGARVHVPTGERRPMATSTVRQVRSVLAAALADAVPEHLTANPLTRTRLPTAAPPAPKAWTQSQVRQLLAAARGTRDEALYHVGLAVGLRLGELRELRWSDLDADARTLTIARSLSDDGKIVGPTKTRRSRVVTLPPETLAVLLAHQKRQPAGEPLLFGHGGRAYAAIELRRRLRLVCREAGIPELSPHSLRHSAASIQLAEGVAVTEIARMLGHTVGVLLTIYSHFIGDDASRSVAAARSALYPSGTAQPGSTRVLHEVG